MIKFGKLRWKNLLSTGNVFTEIDLGSPGTTLIVGSNGSGKSTMLEALSFALYGKSFRKVNKSQLVNSINKKDMVCEVEFELNGNQYLVRRGMKPNVFDVIMNTQSLDKHGAISDLQDHLERYVLKMNYRACMQVVVLGSASYVPFMELTAQHRREVLEDVLDIRVLGSMASLLKSKMEANASFVATARTKVAVASEKLKLARATESARREDVAERVKRLETRRADVEFKLQDAADRGMVLAAKLKKTQDEMIEDESDKLDSMKSRMSALKTTIANDVDRKKFFISNDTCPVCDSEMTEEHKVKELTTLNATIDAASAERDTLAVEIAESTSRVQARTAAVRDVTAIKSEIGTLRGIIAAFQSEIDSIDADIVSSSAPKNIAVADDLMTLEEDLEIVKSSLAGLEEEREVMLEVGALLKDDGVKSAIIKQYVPVLNQMINKYLAALDFFVNFEFDESFNERILSRHRDDFTYNSFSEGEKTRINLAILFTWRAVARMRNSASTNVVIMDEVFDSSLDGAGAEDFTGMMQKMVGDTNVIIISHRTDQMVDKFDRVVKFAKTKNFSGVET